MRNLSVLGRERMVGKANRKRKWEAYCLLLKCNRKLNNNMEIISERRNTHTPTVSSPDTLKLPQCWQGCGENGHSHTYMTYVSSDHK